MSIADKITQLTTIRGDIRSALVDKGISASSHNFSQFAADIASIVPQTTTVGFITVTYVSTGTITCTGEGIGEITQYIDIAENKRMYLCPALATYTITLIDSGVTTQKTATISNYGDSLTVGIARELVLFDSENPYTGTWAGAAYKYSGSSATVKSNTVKITDDGYLSAVMDGSSSASNISLAYNDTLIPSSFKYLHAMVKGSGATTSSRSLILFTPIANNYTRIKYNSITATSFTEISVDISTYTSNDAYVGFYLYTAAKSSGNTSGVIASKIWLDDSET